MKMDMDMQLATSRMWRVLEMAWTAFCLFGLACVCVLVACLTYWASASILGSVAR